MKQPWVAKSLNIIMSIQLYCTEKQNIGCAYMWSIKLNVTQDQWNIFLKKSNIWIILQSHFKNKKQKKLQNNKPRN